MSIARSLLVVFTLVPAGTVAAQRGGTPVVVHIPDLGWLGPVISGAQARATAALSAVGPAMAQVGPALARARVGMAHASAALARTDIRLQGLRGSSRFDFDDQDFDDTPPAPWAQQDPADGIYTNARSALNRGRYADAAQLFGEVYTKHPKSTYAADSYYWQAYALRRRGGNESLKKALDVLAVQKRVAPNASTRRDADQLRTRICGDLAEGGDAECAAEITELATRAVTPPTPPTPATPVTPPTPPSQSGRRVRCDDEDEIQVSALNALLSMDAEKAVPILKKVLARRDPGSVCLRRKAVFLISQHESEDTEETLLNAARTDPDQEVREQAVWWLSQVDSPRATAALDSILRSSTDPALQEKAIFALSQQDAPQARKALRDFALRPNVSEELREKAIFWIGQGDDPDRLEFLKTLYTQLRSESSRDKILFSISQIDDRESQRWLLAVASNTNESIELRKKALFWVGQSDIAVTELFNLYETMPSREMKEQLIFVYSQRDERAAVDKLMSIARSESDRELRKKAIFWLGQSGDPRAADFLASLLEKPPQ
jgi:HEAT repeat protein